MNKDIKDIEIFSEVDESRYDTLRGLFSEQEFDKGAEIVTYGQPVDGLYVLEDGEVAVSIPGFEGVLATLKAGMSFGELSLFSDDDASATVTVSTDKAVLNFCPRESLVKALEEDQLLAAGFYRGSALLVSQRLRSTNQKISGEIAKSIKMASTLIDEISTTGNLGFAQKEIEMAGSSIVSGMTDILKRLLVMKSSGEDISHEDIAHLADRAKEIYYSEFQVFEKVHKELKVLGDHLDNVSRVLSQQEMLEVDEDMSLLDI
ncbi:MAG: cyclic nucleotide-binding domain-containing protein [Gammaproteobacteria bacterium]|nr:cyclic nucleotide-binding domain-containing protein [Gammaproteobacteria bacterium]